MTTVSPEVIEKWRSEFEATRKKKHLSPYLDRDDMGFYIAFNTWLAWEYWVESRQSAVIELPEDDGTIWQNAYVLEAVSHIESQGYRVEVKGNGRQSVC